MIINQSNLQILFTGYRANLQAGFAGVAPIWSQIATEVPSTTKSEKYGWLGQFPRIREWVGDRAVQSIGAHDYSITNKPFESTIAVPRDDIEDDTFGVFAPLMTEMGRSVAAFPDELVFDLVKQGFTQKCYDGEAFFSAGHKVLDEKGKDVAVSNSGGGAGAPWFLLDTSRALKPFIHQKRRAFDFVTKDNPKTSDHVFSRNEYVYGTEGRCNVGFGFWQMAFGSKQPLNKAAFRAARTAMMKQKGDYGRPLGITPTLLVVGPSNGDAARDIILAERDAAGATNTDRNLVKILETPWLE
ncbi:MAG: Mu-like prophage major head subunit gpT family protein [Hyphomicrobium sp.]